MALNVLTETLINAPREQVAGFAADPSNAPRWYVNITSVEWQTEPEVAPGRRAAFIASFMGRRMAYTYEITVFEPGTRMVMEASDGPFPMRTEYQWHDAGEGQTRMVLQNSGGPSGFMALFTPLMRAQMRSANLKDLAALKALMETTA